MDRKPEIEAVWLRRIKTAQDMVKNHRAAPVVNTEIGNYWYALSSLLLVRENGRGLAWSQKLPPDDVLGKVRGLDLGGTARGLSKKKRRVSKGVGEGEGAGEPEQLRLVLHFARGEL